MTCILVPTGIKKYSIISHSFTYINFNYQTIALKLIQNHFHSFSFDQNAIIWVIQAREEAQVQVEDEAEVAINNMNDLVITAA